MRATPPLHADISRHPFQRHHSDRAGVFGDSRLLRRDHIHDDATLEHLCQTTFYLVGTFLAAILLMSIASHVIPLFFVNTTINTTDGYPTPSASKSLCPMQSIQTTPRKCPPARFDPQPGLKLHYYHSSWLGGRWWQLKQ